MNQLLLVPFAWPGERRPLPLEGADWRRLQRAIEEYRRTALMPEAGEE